MKSPSSSKVCRPGSNDGGFVGRDDGAVGVADQVDVEVEGASVAVGSNRGNGRNSSVGKVGRGVRHVGSSMVAATGSKVIGTGSGNGRLVSWDDGTVGVADQGSVQVERPGVAVGNNGSSVGNGKSSVGMVATTSGKVVGTSGSNCRLINRNNSSVGMTNKGSVQVEWSRITVVGNNWSSVGNNGGSVGNNGGSVGNTMCGGKSCEMFRSGCGNCWLVHWHHCAVGVTYLKVGVLMAFVLEICKC